MNSHFPCDIQGILFDYGGTLDAGGDHWSEVIYDSFVEAGYEFSWPVFREAYVYAERYLAKNYVIKPDYTFYDLMLAKITLECEKLPVDMDAAPGIAARVASLCDAHARAYIDKARPILESLAARYPLALVSNFYGNIDTILRTYGIRHLFRGVVESAVIGIRKPDPRIWQIGCVVLDLEPTRVLVVGDSVDKDILPARSLGCATAWIRGRQWRDEKSDKQLDERSTNLDEIAAALLT
ncbi:MAG: HAD family hydrolase [Muribaculaceae bacterium]|nr:HAD family hydrolase [Muribaculaceae bacterium]